MKLEFNFKKKLSTKDKYTICLETKKCSVLRIEFFQDKWLLMFPYWSINLDTLVMGKLLGTPGVP